MQIKKLSSFVTLLLFATTFNASSMEERNQPGWINITGDVLLGTADLTMLSQPDEPSGFATLPPEIKIKIINLLSTNTTATSLKEAAFAINSLVLVNRELKILINDSYFCLKFIKHLAQQFNCSDQEAAEILQTQGAKERLELQNKLYRLCNAYSSIMSSTPSLEPLIEQSIDLSFTYYSPGNHTIFYTPLMLACMKHNKMLGQLCSKGGQLIAINQRNTNGDTALMFALKSANKSGPVDSDNIKLLLDTGADPEITNNAGQTPLKEAQKIGSIKIINLIQDAIDKKYEKK